MKVPQFQDVPGVEASLNVVSLIEVQQLICGEVIEPEGCPNAAVLTASLQACRAA